MFPSQKLGTCFCGLQNWEHTCAQNQNNVSVIHFVDLLQYKITYIDPLQHIRATLFFRLNWFVSRFTKHVRYGNFFVKDKVSL